jgi:hypothetical protein
MRSIILSLVIILTLSALTLTVGTAGPAAPLRTTRSTPVLSAGEDTFDLTAFGAVGDGVTDDGPALQRALDAVANAGGGTIHVPSGSYAIVTPVAKNFSNIPGAHLTIQGVESTTPINVDGSGQELTAGLDLTSEFVIKTGETRNALSLSGLESLLIKDLTFLGTLERVSDAFVTLSLTDIADATIRHCEFYGFASFVRGGAIILAIRSRLKITQTPFLGCTVGSGYDGSVVQNISWKNISITDTVFADYGQRPDFYGKTTWGAVYSWIGIGNAAGVSNLSPRREAYIEHVFLDEGHIFGIASRPDLYPASGSAPIDLIYISRLRMNVTNLGFSGLYLFRANRVFVEESYFGWSHNASYALSIVDVGEAVLDKLECVAAANTIYADARTGRLTVINSIYEHLSSAAQTTLVINTATAEEDPAQYVAQQFRDELEREPDAAGHVYWTRELLLCSGNSQCVDGRQAALANYLSSAPSPVFSITGRVADAAGARLSGVTLNLSGWQAVTTQTDTQGNYRFEGLPTSGAYTVTPVRNNYTFNSSTWTTTAPSGDRVANFTAILNNYSIAGRVLNSTGQGLSGATITLSGSRAATTTTGASGDYSFTVPAEGNYTVSAAKVHYVFTPPSASFSNLSGNRTFNFIGTLNQHAITGRITSVDGSALAGVTVTLSGSQSALAMTGSDGRFSITVPAGGNYTVVPSKTNYLFTPPSAVFTDLDGPRDTTFSGTLQKLLEFSAASYQILEGETSLVVTLVRLGDTSGPASATYSTSDESGLENCNTPHTDEASSGCDYITSIGTVRFAHNETSKTFSIPIIDDGYAEGSESFEVTLSNLVGVDMGSHGTASVTIADNETVNGTNPIERAGSFVRQHYIDFLNREPDASGLAFWTDQITSCGTDATCVDLKRASASAAFFLSIEFRETGYLVYRMYKATYVSLTPVPVRFDEFLPDTQQLGQGLVVGQTGWEQVLETNKQTFAADFVARSRFTNAYLSSMTPEAFVDRLFLNAGVTPSATDRNAAINEFGGAPTTADLVARGRALRRVAENQTLGQQEFNKAFVLMQYFGYLRRNPNDAPDGDFRGYDFWLNKLNQFNGNFVDAEMVKAFIVSGEYRQRFGP